MAARLKWFGIFFVVCRAVTVAAACPQLEPESDPFWKKKEKVFKRVHEERAVIVSVNNRKAKVVKGLSQELYLQGVGLMNVPIDFAYARAQRFADYPRMSSMIKAAQFDPSTNRLDMTMEAFNYRARLKMSLELRPSVGPVRDIRFCVLEGVFKDMSGVLRMSEVGGSKSEISLTALQGFDKLPLPSFFMEFGLEVAMRVVAEKMRSFVEDASRDQKGK